MRTAKKLAFMCIKRSKLTESWDNHAPTENHEGHLVLSRAKQESNPPRCTTAERGGSLLISRHVSRNPARLQADRHCAVTQTYPVSLTFASWNQFGEWLNKLDGIRQSRFATACIQRQVADGVGHVTGDEVRHLERPAVGTQAGDVCVRAVGAG
jgi:hypothetical protein